LFDVPNGTELWTHEYESSVEDIFEIQIEISNAVASALKKEFSVDEFATPSNNCRADRSGYEFFLKGLKYLDERGPDQWKKAVESFKKSVEKSPECAAAREGLATGMGLLSLNGIISPQESVPQWRDATSKALVLDPTNSEAHLNQANLSFYIDWKWEQAESEYLDAIKLNPSDAAAFQYYSLFLAARHRQEEAIEAIGHAIRLDPLSARIAVSAGVVFRLNRQFDTSMAHVESAIEFDPENYGAYLLRGSIHQANQEWEQAVDAYRRSLELGGGQNVLSVLSTVYASMGKRDEASGLLTLLLGLGKYQYISAFNIARVYSALGDDDNAYVWLEKACDDGNGELAFFDAERNLGPANILGSSFNSDPRIIELLKRKGLL
jgi:tetratricopeptide (TPR) repeat protein